MSWVPVLLNTTAGPAYQRQSAKRIAALFEKNGIEARILPAGKSKTTTDLAHDTVRKGCDVMVAAGGDGTVRGVAAALVNTPVSLGVVPLGTLNHFARDLRIPVDVEGAIQTIARRRTEQVDVGEVNGKIFVNNSSIGIYPNIVLIREREQRLGYGKWPAFAKATLAVLKRFPFWTAKLHVEGRSIVEKTPFVFVGNNEYKSEGLEIGRRERLNAGHLFLYVAAHTTRWGFIRMALSALFGHLDKTRTLQVLCADEAWIETRHKHIRVATDGGSRACAVRCIIEFCLDRCGLSFHSRMRTLLHLSDIHFGRFNETLREPLLKVVAAIQPDLVALSGDLTQRARPEEFQAAREFLAALPKPQIVVPGNHDVPLHNLPARLYQPLANYRRYITDDLHPFHADSEIAILGLNTARSLVWKNGRINPMQVARIEQEFCAAGPRVTKVLVTHHPFDLPEHYTSRDLVGRARLAMKTIANCGVDLLLAGHFHIGHAGHTAVRYSTAGHSAIFVQAGTLSTRERGEPASFNAIRSFSHGSGARHIEVERYWFSDEAEAFLKTATERFEYGEGGWKAV